LRAKTLASGPFLDLVSSVNETARTVDARVIVNDRADLAVLAGAAGVHVGQTDLPPADVRRIVGGEAVVGLSTHTSTQIDDALQQAISYLAIGPVYGTSTKATGYEAVGLNAVRDAVQRAAPRRRPVVAIGGMTLASAPAVIEAGAASVAVIGDLLVGDPEARARQYLSALA
jgi:thiamine-phosphate pyrophosphorylase